MKSTVYEIVTDRIIEILERGVVPWRKTWNDDISVECSYSQYNYSKKGLRAYRGINPFLLVGRYASPYWLTYRQCEEMGGHVKKGERGSIVVFWKREEKELSIIDAVTGKHKVENRFILRYYNVFNIEQCEGIAGPSQEVKDKSARPLISSCQSLVDSMKDKPRIIIDSKAYYSPLSDFIGCPSIESFESSEAYYSTLFHEIGHWTGHSSRLDREGIKSVSFGSEVYSKEELIAEMSAAFLCDLTGISQKTLDNSASYIASWLRSLKNDKTLVVKAAGAAQRAVDFITKVEPMPAIASSEETSLVVV